MTELIELPQGNFYVTTRALRNLKIIFAGHLMGSAIPPQHIFLELARNRNKKQAGNVSKRLLGTIAVSFLKEA